MSFSNYIGQILDGKYKLDREIGRGGMGTVFLATHLGTERPVALKIIAPQFMQRAEFVERFRREARAAGRLRHPNVVDVTDFGITDSVNGKIAYLVMEYLDGCTLGEILEEEKQLPLHWTIDILEQVCSAVEEAHNQGIIHRDLKPDNIWLEPNQRGGYTVKVLDFGIAKLEEQGKEPAVYREVLPDSPLFQAARATVADISQDETKADTNHATLVSEAATMAQFGESKTLIGEAGTMIQIIQPEPEEESTAIFENNKTAILTSEDVGTKIISEQIETHKSIDKNTDKAIAEKKNTSELTRVGAVLGTPLFMSPEQCRGEKLSASSDIYSLGVIAYRMLSGKTPFDGDHTAVMSAHQEIEPPPLEVKKIPKNVKKVIFCALSKNAEERPQTAEAFASQLRSQSEGLGTLLQKALVLYSEHLPKFLLLAVITSIPNLLSSIFRAIVGTLASLNLLNFTAANVLFGVIGLASFFFQFFSAALLFGTVAWIVAQILAVPLQPVSIRFALKAAWAKKRSLFTAVLLQSALSWFGMMLCLIPGLYWSTVYMLTSPSIMIENVKGRAAFRRSKELVKRSATTAFALVVITHLIPFIGGITIGGIVMLATKSAIVQKNEPNNSAKNDGERNIDINIGAGSIRINENPKNVENPISDEEKQKQKLEEFRKNTLRQGLMDLVLIPFTLIMSSLFSIVTALMYFKARQAGGESMQDLLEQFEEKDQPRKKWQERVRNRLMQSGRITSGTSKS